MNETDRFVLEMRAAYEAEEHRRMFIRQIIFDVLLILIGSCLIIIAFLEATHG